MEKPETATMAERIVIYEIFIKRIRQEEYAKIGNRGRKGRIADYILSGS